MQKMKSGLMMFCLTVLLSYAALMMNTPTASAMSLNDLQGTYRIVKSTTNEEIGSIISIKMENGELIGRVQKPSRGSADQWAVDDIFMEDVFVDNGKVRLRVLGYPHVYSSAFMNVSSNGAVFDIRFDFLPGVQVMELHRL